jgi:GWxTD domain-containing protein
LTCCDTRPIAALAALLLVAAACAPAAQEGGTSLDLVNPLLGPDYSQWLVGPVARLAGAAEVDAFLALTDAAAAARFVEEFWARRDPDPAEPGNPVAEAFAARAAEADKRYSEAGYLGRRTARGTTHVLFGPPEKVDYQIPPDERDPPIEVWEYPAGAPAGLSGERPARAYRFIKRGDVTVFYVPRNTPDRGMPRIDEF